MTTSKFLPVCPSLESIRKQAKKFARDIAAGNVDAIARARTQLPNSELPLSQRDAQLVLSREYGFAGWQQLREEILKRIGNGLEWALIEAKRVIHDNDVERLKQLLVEYPALLSWRDENGGTLLSAATNSYGDSGDAYREQIFTRPACAELLIDAGAAVDPSVWKHAVSSRASGMLQLLSRKGALPRTLITFVALGDLDSVRECFEESGALPESPSNDDLAAVNEAFMCACRFKHKAIASFLLERCIALDNDLCKRIDNGLGRSAFIEYLIEHAQTYGNPWQKSVSPWQTYVMNKIMRAMDANDLSEFTRWLESDSYLLGESCVSLQVEMFEHAALKNREAFIAQLLDLDPAILKSRTPPQSSALIFAIEYGNADLVPLLTRIWPMPDDLPHAAAMGNLARVKHWFDGAGRPALGNIDNHYPTNNPHVRTNQHWGAANAQQILDVALAWACMNRQLKIAAFLLDHGADINTNWSTHEPASILHELVFHDNYEAMQFLIDHGIDMTIRDYRWNATAEGWAYNAAKNEAMANFLAAAERQRKPGAQQS